MHDNDGALRTDNGGDRDGAERVPESASISDAADAEIGKLSPRAAALLHLHFGLGQPRRDWAQTATALGLSPSAVRRLERNALRRLRWLSLRANAFNGWDEV